MMTSLTVRMSCFQVKVLVFSRRLLWGASHGRCGRCRIEKFCLWQLAGTSADEAGGEFDLICRALQLYTMNTNHDSAGQTNAAEPRPASENKIFRKWHREFSLLTGYGIDPEERVFAISRRNCERRKKDLLNYSTSVFPLHLYISLTEDIGPPVQFMLKHLKLAGVNCMPAHIPCLPCDLTRSGGFSPDAGAIVLCQGNFLNKKHMEHTLVHELVHMYDHAVFNVDWSNLRHHACSEVRLAVILYSSI